MAMEHATELDTKHDKKTFRSTPTPSNASLVNESPKTKVLRNPVRYDSL